MSEVKLSGIKDSTAFPFLIEKGFNKAKSCGTGSIGYIRVLGLNLIETLILRQKSNMNNLIFILEQLDENEDRKNFPSIFEIFDSIQSRTANHTQFVVKVKNDPNLLNEVALFALKIFRIESFNIPVLDISNSLVCSSTNLNVQFIFYNETQVLYEVKENPYILPLVLNFYYSMKTPDTFYMLYHENYELMSEENLNYSTFYKPGIEDPYKAEDIKFIQTFISQISSYPNLNPEQTEIFSQIQQEFQELSQ